MRNGLISLLAVPVMAFSVSGTSLANDPAAGYAIAKDECARCHNIEKGGAFKLRPPSFQAIAIYRTADDIWARIIAPSPHSGMPDVQWMLTPDQVQSLLAYITSLDTP